MKRSRNWKDYYTPAQAAAKAEVSLRTIQRRLKARPAPFPFIQEVARGLIKIPKRAFHNYIASRTHGRREDVQEFAGQL